MRQLCTFYVDDLYLGVGVDKVQEVIRYQRMTGIPLTSNKIEGLINLRGQIVTAIDMRTMLQLPQRPEGKLPMNVILHADDGGALSLLVDEIGDVLELEDARFERPPETLQGVARELIRGAYKLENKLLLIVNSDKIRTESVAA